VIQRLKKNQAQISLTLLSLSSLPLLPLFLSFSSLLCNYKLPAPLHKQQITHPQKATKIKSPSLVAELHGICLLGEIRRRYGFQKLETKKSK
jgi:hypothetical protein